MAEAFVSIGSNIQREKHIAQAVALLSAHYGRLRVSTVYESDAVGFAGNPFYNLVASFSTHEPPLTVAEQLRSIEDRCGRIREGARYGSRTLDLDLLLYDDMILTTDNLSLPRSEILTQAFVLGPLAELAADLTHPVQQQTFGQLWAQHATLQEPLRPVDFDFTGILAVAS
ncbi:MAG: 2-amino-4-hydroxy-6-hydroxymethyldihydropteridine diphosphokinase [Gammaproteobacteria bacterium]